MAYLASAEPDSARARAQRRADRILGRDTGTPLRAPVFETPSPARRLGDANTLSTMSTSSAARSASRSSQYSSSSSTAASSSSSLHSHGPGRSSQDFRTETLPSASKLHSGKGDGEELKFRSAQKAMDLKVSCENPADAENANTTVNCASGMDHANAGVYKNDKALANGQSLKSGETSGKSGNTANATAAVLGALESALWRAAEQECWRDQEARGNRSGEEGLTPKHVMEARLQRLRPILEDMESGEVGVADSLAEELGKLEKINLELSWERLWQYSQTRRVLTSLISAREKLAKQCTEPELARKTEFLETARAKCAVMQAECTLDTYGRQDQQEALTQIAWTLEMIKAEIDRENKAMEQKLEELKLLPRSLVEEYDDLQAAISERRDYVQRLRGAAD
mmetsp:Transcript_16241/g.31449  ORF Transcript_16241/g.31449 Transcript_16241/m.31449 type:complete len:398 (-) Transcript_16241:461-1654(-)|eukprot:CAMPEP_0171530102 /NCGR_PEP_ID=MMETSP0959-20130129/12823_1 /TAXON_ID=87120 /ORGANISM="Aurantiochytrium limacinum, Strain ATCCMYA-1381" /LENGTH=397 /DNA_ID=CAMNT_0012072721 /DNA_START=22 /DNA_END=1215 /DNA_ORIENTATION=+